MCKWPQRETLHDFIVTYREMAKEVDDRSVYDAPEWLVVAGLELLFQAMFCEAVAISSEREEAREE